MNRLSRFAIPSVIIISSSCSKDETTSPPDSPAETAIASATVSAGDVQCDDSNYINISLRRKE